MFLKSYRIRKEGLSFPFLFRLGSSKCLIYVIDNNESYLFFIFETLNNKIMKERTIKEVLENQKRCKPGEYDREILDIAYKSRVGISLSAREKELSEAYFKGRW